MHLSSVRLNQSVMGLFQHGSVGTDPARNSRTRGVEPEVSIRRGQPPIQLETVKPAKNIFDRWARKVEGAVVSICKHTAGLVGGIAGFVCSTPVLIPAGIGAAAVTGREEAGLVALFGAAIGFWLGEHIGAKAGVIPAKLCSLPFSVMSGVAEIVMHGHL